MEARAEARYIRVSPQKARLVVDLIRGQRAGDAINILRSTNKGIAPTVEKVLRSAIANAEHNDGADIDELKVTRIYVEKGPVMKRFSARAKGRGVQILKPTCHVYVTVGDGRK